MLRSIACFLGLHNWEYAPRKVALEESFGTWDMRRCKCCPVEQIKMHEYPGFKPREWETV